MILDPRLRIAILAAALLLPARGADLAEPGRPPLWTMSDADVYAFGSAWAVTQDAQGRILAGTDGLVVFDGARWKYFSIPGAQTVQGVSVDPQGRVWVGAFGGLGWFDRQPSGDYTYHSLREQLPPSAVPLLTGGIWAVNALPGEVVFSANEGILIWRDHHFKVLPLPGGRRLFTTRFRDELFITHTPTGFYELKDDRLVLLSADPTFAHAGTFLTERLTADRLCLVRSDGLWMLDRGKLTNVCPSTGDFLRPHLVTSAARLRDGDILVGLAKGGLVLLGADGTIKRRLVFIKGMPSSVNALTCDGRGNIWIADYNQGLCSLDLQAPVSVYDADNGLTKHVLSLASRGNDLLVGSVDGLFEISGLGTPAETPGMLSQDAHDYFQMQWLGNRLLGGYMHGVDDVTAAPRELVRMERDTYALAASNREPDTFYLATENHISRVSLPSGAPPVRTPLASLPSDATSLAEDAFSGLLVATNSSGLFRLGLDGEPPVTPQRLAGPPFLEAGGWTWIGRSGQNLIVSKESGAWVEHADGNWRRISGVPSGKALAMAPSAAGGMWLLYSHAEANGRPFNMLVRADDLGSDRPFATEFDLPALQDLGAVTAMVQTRNGDRRLLWVGGRQGVARIVPRLLTPTTEPVAPIIDAASWNLRNRAFNVEYSSVDYRHVADLLFQTRLLGQSETWSPASHLAFAAYSGLRAGQYSFQVRALAPDGAASPLATFDFSLPPAWYNSYPAYAVFVLAGVGGILGLTAWRGRRLRRRQRELERVVAARTTELIERTRQLESASRAKDDFVASISHEIRNPLNGLVGLATTLEATLGDNTDARQRQHLSMLRHCADHLSTLIEEILDFSALESGKFSSAEEPFAVAHLLNTVYAVVFELSAISGIPVDLQVAPSVPARLVGDAKRIRQILLNYLYNALRYAGRGRVTLAVAAVPAESGRFDVTFSVADEGPGIPKAEQAALFTKFTRGELGRRSGYGGTGLGLAVCRALAGQLGGKTSVASEPGAGATFFLSLNLAAAPEPPPSEQPAPAQFALPYPALIVEDQRANVAALAALLTGLGLQSDRAGDAETALDLTSSRPYGVIFCDGELPGLSGTEFSRRLRAGHGINARTPIIALTAFATEAKRRECLAAGMNAFATKPMTLDKLAAALGEALPTAGRPFRLEALRTVARGDPVALGVRMDSYLAELDAYVAALAAAVDEVNFESLRRTAHKLSSHLAVISHDPGYVLATALEQAGADQDLAATRARFAQLRFVLRDLRAQLRSGPTYS